MKVDTTIFTIDCTGDVCAGDVILFTEGVFGGSYRRPKYLGERRIAAKIVKDSYGGTKQQHTFTIEVIASDGYSALEVGTKTTRKGRNIYRNGTMRQPWDNEAERSSVLDDKHKRGDCARILRKERINGYDIC